MKNNASLVYNVLLVVGDFLALVAAFVAAYVVRVKIDARPLLEPVAAMAYLKAFLIILPFWIFIFALLGLYNKNIYEKRFAEFGRLLVGSFIGLMFVVFIDFASKNPIFPARLVPIYGFAIGFVLLVLNRNILRFGRHKLFSFKIGLANIVVVGNSAVTAEVVQTLSDPRTGYNVVALVGTKHPADSAIPTYRSFSTFLASRPSGVHGIIQTEMFKDDARNTELLTYAQENHMSYRFVPGNIELFVGNIEVELFRSSMPVIVVRQTALFGWGRIVKRLSDIIMGSILLALASPVMVVVALFIKLTDGNDKIFFRQQRLTRFNKTFTMYKFRTTLSEYTGIDPEEAFPKMGKPELVKLYRDNGDQIPNDPRFSVIGRILRKTSLDELPQLINVVRGDISLVGPRPLIPRELAAYNKRHTILSVKSGLTGLAQILGRRDISFEERRKLDVYYVQNWSLWLDLVILAKTFRSVIGGRGASH